MVVDDDAETRLLLDSVLGREEGHEVRYADDGDSAIARLDRMKPDVVITDIEMPRMNGVRLIQHLQSTQSGARVIAISGKGADRLERAVDAGAMIALSKPLERQSLVDALEQALSASDPWRTGR
jgi:CheY-like chemotaxis protein